MSVVETANGGSTLLTRYVRELADAMELRDWRIILPGESPDGEGAAAEVKIPYGRKIANVNLARSWFGDTPEEKRHILVHELVHCHTALIDSMVENDLEKLLGVTADRIFYTAYKRGLEYMVDGLAAAIAKHLPLPPKGV